MTEDEEYDLLKRAINYLDSLKRTQGGFYINVSLMYKYLPQRELVEYLFTIIPEEDRGHCYVHPSWLEKLKNMFPSTVEAND